MTVGKGQCGYPKWFGDHVSLMCNNKEEHPTREDVEIENLFAETVLSTWKEPNYKTKCRICGRECYWDRDVFVKK